MVIELLYVDGCPGHQALVARLSALLPEAGVAARVRQRRVTSDAEAQRERFLGSPTLRFDGVDVDPTAGERSDFGVQCRLYATAEGLQGTPSDPWIRAALQRAVEAESTSRGPCSRWC